MCPLTEGITHTKKILNLCFPECWVGKEEVSQESVTIGLLFQEFGVLARVHTHTHHGPKYLKPREKRMVLGW